MASQMILHQMAVETHRELLPAKAARGWMREKALASGEKRPSALSRLSHGTGVVMVRAGEWLQTASRLAKKAATTPAIGGAES